MVLNSLSGPHFVVAYTPSSCGCPLRFRQFLIRPGQQHDVVYLPESIEASTVQPMHACCALVVLVAKRDNSPIASILRFACVMDARSVDPMAELMKANKAREPRYTFEMICGAHG